MKKILLILAILLVLAGGVVLWKVAQMRRSQPVANYLTQETIALLAIEDLPGTSLQWMQTSLAKLFSNEDILKAIEGTESEFWATEEASQGGGYLVSLQPKQVFASLLDRGDQGLALLGGVHYVGSKSSAEAGLQRMREFLAGSETEPILTKETVDGVEMISQILKGGITLISANVKGWIIFSDSQEVLLNFVTAIKAGAEPQSLAQDVLFENIAGQLDPDCELQAFLRVGPALDRLLTFASMMGTVPDPNQVEFLKKAEGIGYSSTFKGKDIEDRLFVKTLTAPATSVIKKTGAELASEQSLFLYEAALDFSSPSWKAFTEKIPGSILLAADEKGLDFETLPKLLTGAAVWSTLGEGELIPNMEGMLTLEDSKKAEEWIDFFLSQQQNNKDIGKESRDGATIYTLGVQGSIAFLEPCIALREGELLAALNPDALNRLMLPKTDGTKSLAESQKFAELKKYYDSSPSTFVYLDTAELVRRAYEMSLPVIRFGALTLKDVDRYVNTDALPDKATFADELGPIVGVQYNRPDGFLFESRGPLTLNHLLIMGAAGGFSAFGGK